jgi:hypothetical protein
MLTANGMVVAASVDHAAGDVDVWYGNSILRVQIKVTNTTSSPVPFDPLATEVRDSEHLITPLSLSDVLKLAPPSQAGLAARAPSGPGVYNPGTAGPGASEQPDVRKDAERAHAYQVQGQKSGSTEIFAAPARGNPTSSKQARQVLSAFYAARMVEPGQFLSGFLYFKAPKLSKEFVLRIPVGQTVYEIPFGNPK